MGVPNGDGRSGSIRRLALRLVKNAITNVSDLSLQKCDVVVWLMSCLKPTTLSHDHQPKQKIDIPALVLNPGNDGIAGIAFSNPE